MVSGVDDCTYRNYLLNLNVSIFGLFNGGILVNYQSTELSQEILCEIRDEAQKTLEMDQGSCIKDGKSIHKLFQTLFHCQVRTFDINYVVWRITKESKLFLAFLSRSTITSKVIKANSDKPIQWDSRRQVSDKALKKLL